MHSVRQLSKGPDHLTQQPASIAPVPLATDMANESGVVTDLNWNEDRVRVKAMPKDALTPQARYHFTRFDQVDQLAAAREADADLGFMARMMALCSLPRTNPGNRKEYKRVNGPFTLYMVAVCGNKLPFGNLPRLLLAWAFARAASRISLMRSRSASGISDRSSIRSETSSTRCIGGKCKLSARAARRKSAPSFAVR